ncbi:IS110 family transposase [Kitasatospora sp. NPDC088346]|uniref:IS110 family transposase n=1 Tax=Kitasatospora sp. NPDC088346 TaxID=3364073 RepID=UPI003829F6B2
MGGRTGAMYAGIDWSEGLNDLAVVDSTGEVVASARIPETPEGLREVLSLLSGLKASHQHSRRHVPVAIETGRSLLVAGLRQAGQPVVVVHPTVVAAYRQTAGPTRKKSDREDAALLAQILRTDGHRHQEQPQSTDDAEAVRALARAQLKASRTRQFHLLRLRSQLRLVHPAALTAWDHLPGKIGRGEARSVIAAAPTSRSAACLSKRRLYDLLETGGRTRNLDDHAARLFTEFRRPVLMQTPLLEEALGHEVRVCVELLDVATSTAQRLAALAVEAFDRHPQADIYRSFPGVGELTGPRLLGEIGDAPARFASARGLRGYAGAAPLTWTSGGSRVVFHRRKGANNFLKTAGHYWSFSAIGRSPGARAHYDRRRAAGERHTAALRHVFGRLLGCLHHCLTHGETYREEAAWPHTGT